MRSKCFLICLYDTLKSKELLLLVIKNTNSFVLHYINHAKHFNFAIVCKFVCMKNQIIEILNQQVLNNMLCYITQYIVTA